MHLKTKFGDYHSEELSISKEEFKTICNESLKYNEANHSMWLDDKKTFCVIPKNVLQESILSIEIIE